MGGNKTGGLWLQGFSTLIGLTCWGINSQVLAQIVGDRTVVPGRVLEGLQRIKPAALIILL